jgi:hypothetical protein
VLAVQTMRIIGEIVGVFQTPQVSAKEELKHGIS